MAMLSPKISRVQLRAVLAARRKIVHSYFEFGGLRPLPLASCCNYGQTQNLNWGNRTITFNVQPTL